MLQSAPQSRQGIDVTTLALTAVASAAAAYTCSKLWAPERFRPRP